MYSKKLTISGREGSSFIYAALLISSFHEMLSLGAIFRPRCLFRIQGMLIIQSFQNAKTNQDKGSSTRSSNPPKRFMRWESRSAFHGCQNILIVTERGYHSIGQGRRLQSKIDLFSPLLIRERAQPPITSSQQKQEWRSTAKFGQFAEDRQQPARDVHQEPNTSQDVFTDDYIYPQWLPKMRQILHFLMRND